MLIACWSGLKLLQPVDRYLYDIFSNNAYETVYGGDTFLPTLKMLVFSEKTEQNLGQWSKKKTETLAHELVDSGALAVAFYPGSLPELKPSPEAKVIVAPGLNSPISGVVLDEDGICRRIALATFERGIPTPTMPLKILAALNRIDETDISYQPSAIMLGYRRIATSSDYSILVRFRKSTESLSATAMAQSEANKKDPFYPVALENFENPLFKKSYLRGYTSAVVLVGTGLKDASTLIDTTFGPLNDYKVAACAVETAMGGFQIKELTGAQKIISILAIALACYTVFSRMKVLFTAIFWVMLQAGWLNLSATVFTLGLYLGYIVFFIPSTLVAIATSVLKFRQANQALKRFGGKGAQEAAHWGSEVVFSEIREKLATIVFTNVPSYLKELERSGSPSDFFTKRQAYAQLLSDVFRKHQGVILDYQGDFQMIGFNVELRQDDEKHSQHAVEASIDFLDSLTSLTHSWPLTTIKSLGSMHCGICTGQVACGHVGSHRHDGGRIAQAAIGDTSNVAARLLAAAMKMGEPIIIAETTVTAGLGNIETEALEPVPLKGKSQPVPIARLSVPRKNEAAP